MMFPSTSASIFSQQRKWIFYDLIGSYCSEWHWWWVEKPETFPDENVTLAI